ncbi:nuclear transport factor 2 family protein [Actinomadura luteofluorescens]|uniref:nuclear transport factor 2 family protein n=1 Tax=Actinomadura luteofluorescens TaxID=46163 RepID=UPI003D934D48
MDVDQVAAEPEQLRDREGGPGVLGCGDFGERGALQRRSAERERPGADTALAGSVGLMEDLRDAERRLQAAQLAGDVEALDRLLDDRLIFTFGGNVQTKADDLEVHRTRTQVLTKVAEEDLTVLADGTTGVTWFLGTVEGTVSGAPFAARMRYTRTWLHDETYGWRIIAVHASVAD